MKLHWYAKLFGWAQFIVTVVPQVLSQQTHGWQGWLQSIASLAAAVGIHAASSTDGSK